MRRALLARSKTGGSKASNFSKKSSLTKLENASDKPAKIVLLPSVMLTNKLTQVQSCNRRRIQ